MNIINKMERRFGNGGIAHLIQYILGISIVGNVLNVMVPGIYQYFYFDFDKILHGQIWRLFTFMLMPSVSRENFFIDLIWFVIWLSLYYYVGTALEQMWGTFRFNLYYFVGIALIWVIGIGGYLYYYVQMGSGAAAGLIAGASITPDYLNLSMFLAFAALFPDMQFLVYFIIPVKAKWLGIFDLVYMGYLTVRCLVDGAYVPAALIVGAVANFAIFYFAWRGNATPAAAYRQRKRKMEYKKKAAGSTPAGGPIHRCAICGRTEQDAPDLDFRYCSKCEGSYEYCSDHLFTHEHVHR